MSKPCLFEALNQGQHLKVNRDDDHLFLVQCKVLIKWTTQKLAKSFLMFCLVTLSICNLPNAYAKHLLIFGDSLSAAYGMEWEKGWAQLIDQQWVANESEHNISNASISGETTAGGLARLPLTLEELKPDVVLIELGANDGLRGHPIKTIRQNLIQMIDLSKATGASVLLGGISLPPSYGQRYIDQFRQVFRDVAEEKEIPYLDFFNESFFSKPGYIQSDGLHPTEVTQPLIRDTVLRFLSEHDALQ